MGSKRKNTGNTDLSDEGGRVSMAVTGEGEGAPMPPFPLYPSSFPHIYVREKVERSN